MLITGASGFTGKHACNYFLKAGFNIAAVSRKKIDVNKDIQIEFCDLANKDQVKSLVKKIKPQYLLHLAGQNNVSQSWLDPISSLEANVMSTAYLIDEIRHENPSCKMVVVGSALQFYPEDMSTLLHPYSLSKTLQVLIAKSWEVLYNMDIMIAKPSNLIGPGFSNGVCSIFAKKIVDMEINEGEKMLKVNNLDSQRDFIDVRDALRAYETLLTKGESGEIYEIASGKSRSLKEIINGFKDLTAVDFKIQTEVKNEIEQPVEIKTLKLIKLGWKPVIPFETSLKDILDFYRMNKQIELR